MTARELCEKALRRDGAESYSGAVALINLAEIANTERRPEDGAAFGRQAIVSTRNRDDLQVAAWAAIVTSWSLADLGELERAGRLLGAATAFTGRSGAQRQRTELVSEEHVILALSAQLDDRQIQTLLAEGREMPIEVALRDAASGGRPAPATSYQD